MISNLPLPIKILLISFNSEWHQDVWNILAIETLYGDLIGEFGSLINIDTMRLGPEDEIDKNLIMIQEYHPHLIGFSLDIGSHNIFFKLLDNLKNAGICDYAKLVCGGTLCTYSYDYFFKNQLFSELKPIIIIGEGELALRDIVYHCMGQRDLIDICNIMFFNDEKGKYIANEVKNQNIDLLVHPPITIPYNNLKHRVHILQASRNCIFNCSYCTQGPHKKWRSLPLQRVKKNLDDLLSQGITEFEFVDDEFFGGISVDRIDRAEEISNIMLELQKKHKAKIQFRIFTNPYIISSKIKNSKGIDFVGILKALKQTGLCRVYLGVESWTLEQRKRYNRKDSIEDCLNAINILKNLKINIDAGFIMFDPEVSIKEIKENIRLIYKTNFLEYNTWPFRPMTITEGTPLYDRVKALNLLYKRDKKNISCFNYRFINPDVELIYSEVERIAQYSSKIFYNLKYLFKENHFNIEDSDIRLLNSFIVENAEINLKLIERLIGNIESNQNILQTREWADEKIIELITKIEKNMGRFNQTGASTKYIDSSIKRAKSSFGIPIYNN